jgi:hypothetical protein
MVKYDTSSMRPLRLSFGGFVERAGYNIHLLRLLMLLSK